MEKTYTVQAVRELIHGIGQPLVTELNGMMDKVPDALKAGMNKIYTDLNAFLASLNPTEQIPAAQEASWMLSSLARAMEQFRYASQGIAQNYARLTGEYNGKVSELNGFMTRVTAGELVEKSQVAELQKLAIEEGRKSLLPEIVATRKQAVELAGLPLPADEAVFALPAAEYAGRLTLAQTQVAALAAKGLTLGTAAAPGKGAKIVAAQAWKPATEFAGFLELVADLPVKAGGDPLLGNKPADEKPAAPAKGVFLI